MDQNHLHRLVTDHCLCVSRMTKVQRSCERVFRASWSKLWVQSFIFRSWRQRAAETMTELTDGGQRSSHRNRTWWPVSPNWQRSRTGWESFCLSGIRTEEDRNGGQTSSSPRITCPNSSEWMHLWPPSSQSQASMASHLWMMKHVTELSSSDGAPQIIGSDLFLCQTFSSLPLCLFTPVCPTHNTPD